MLLHAGKYAFNPRAIPTNNWTALRLTLSALLFLLLLLTTHNRYFPHIRHSPTDPYAYIFYTTSDTYACSALINALHLLTTLHTPHPIYILSTPGINAHYLTRFQTLNITVITSAAPPISGNDGNNNGYYHDSLLKLMAFGIYNHVPHLKRVIVLDADQLVLRSLDHLFHLPSVPLAAPRAYWLNEHDSEGDDKPPRHGGLTSALMVIEQSPATWAKVKTGLQGISQNTYDMDLVKSLFGETALLLPGSYTTLNSHWEAWDLPAWYTGNARGDAEVVPEYERGWNVSDRRMVDLFNEAFVVHFTAGGKPWGQGARYEGVEKHWLFAEQRRLWREGLAGSSTVVGTESVEDSTRGYELHGPVLGANDLCLAETVGADGFGGGNIDVETDVSPEMKAERECERKYMPFKLADYDECVDLARLAAEYRAMPAASPEEQPDPDDPKVSYLGP